MQALRERLDALGAQTGKRYLLSFAAGAGATFVKNVELPQLARIVDFVNLMTYDMNGPWSQTTGFNAPLCPDPLKGRGGWSVAEAVQLFLDGGVPKEKLVVGIPFYGHEYKGVKPANDGLYQTFASANSLPYRRIKEIAWAFGSERLKTPDRPRANALCRDTFISFEDPESIAAKARFIRENGLAGAMIWEISHDTADHELLKRLHAELHDSR